MLAPLEVASSCREMLDERFDHRYVRVARTLQSGVGTRVRPGLPLFLSRGAGPTWTFSDAAVFSWKPLGVWAAGRFRDGWGASLLVTLGVDRIVVAGRPLRPSWEVAMLRRRWLPATRASLSFS